LFSYLLLLLDRKFIFKLNILFQLWNEILLYWEKLWFWNQHLKCQSKLNMPGKAVRFSIGSPASSSINEAITASNIMNIKFKIRNNKLDQLQGMSAKMAANEIWTHARTNQWRTLESRSRQSRSYLKNASITFLYANMLVSTQYLGG